MKVFKKVQSFFIKDKAILFKIFLTIISRGVAAIGTFLFDFILAKSLGVDDFGNFMMAFTLLIGFSFLARFGLPFGILRFSGVFYENNKISKIVKLRRLSFLLSTGLSLLLGTILILSHNFFSNLFFDGKDVYNLLFLVAIALPFHANILIQSSFIKSFKKPELAPLFEIGLLGFTSAFILFVLTFFNFQFTIESTFLIFTVSATIILILGYFILNKILNSRIESFDDEVLDEEVFLSTLPDYALSSIIGYFLRFSPVLILGYFYSSNEVGLFSIANRISFVISFVLWIFHSVYAPVFANLFNNKKIEELQALVKRSVLYMLLVSFPLLLIIITFPNQILGVFGSEFKQAKAALIILSISQLVNVMTGPVYFLLNMTGYQKKMRNVMIITMAINLALSISLIPQFGFVGAAISSGFGLVLQNLLAFRLCRKYLNIKMY